MHKQAVYSRKYVQAIEYELKFLMNSSMLQ